MKTNIFRANVNTPYGIFTVAVSSTSQDAKNDIISAVRSELPSHLGQIRVEEIKKSSRKIVNGMEAIKHCKNSTAGQWAWIKKAS